MTTTTNTNIPTPAEVYMSQGERALNRGTHFIEESIWVYLMRTGTASIGGCSIR
ncbi:hypothetical protein [Rhodococcus sp. JS3073]|uniref:hypothetical protein n=1 Tax=Rhodococcus sp. JS3073 TaxID=3002901 RepID=UPI002286A31A|nr:hypothetical protein [Rhodococcus sp. JS3073]WAM19232.1 hypothetical protein OYT95_42700 [Rhodococcus sp. JS3073]